MTKEELLESLEDFEEIEWIEYKTNYPADHFYHEIGEYISALSNAAAYCKTEQAYMIWGVDDKSRKVIGTNFNYNTSVKGEPFKHYLSRMLHPKISFKFEEIEYKGKRIVLLTVPAAVLGPTDFDKVRYFRIGSSKVDLRDHFYDEKDLWRALSGDDEIVNIPAYNQNLTFNFLNNYLHAHGYDFNKETYDTNLHLRTPDGKYNLMAELLADKNDIVMNVSKFLTTTKAEFVERKEFGYKCLLYAMDMAMGYVDTLNHTFVYVGSGVRQEKEMFDSKAFREAWINACVHFKWCDGHNPGIYFYSDRLEIESLGGIPKNLTRRQFLKGHSKPVNPELFNIFKMCGFVEETGHGVPKVVEVYGENAIDADGGTMNVIIPFAKDPFHPGNDGSIGSNDISETYHKPIIKPIIKSTQELILENLKNNSRLNKTDLAFLLSKPEGTIQYHLNKMKSNNVIEHIGPKNGGMWIVKEENFIESSFMTGEGQNVATNVSNAAQIVAPDVAPDVTPKIEFASKYEKILVLLRNNPEIKTSEIAKTLNVDRRTIQRYLKELEQKNVIKRDGNNQYSFSIVIKKEKKK